MKFPTLFSVMSLGVLGTTFASTNSTLDALISNSTANLRSILNTRSSNTTCTSENVLIRKEWATLASKEKLEYINAVKCLMKKDPVTPSFAAPGVRSHYDDFAALHINETTTIHWTSYFFAWHRYFTWIYETALREECGYNGTQPYWDWASTDTIEEHPLFDGSMTSISGNGAQIDHNTTLFIPTPNITVVTLAAGTGGGCLTSGPFVNHTITLGSYGPPLTNGLEYNERCLVRDFRDSFLQQYLRYDNITQAMIQPDLQSFHNQVEFARGSLHGSGHSAIGGIQDDLWGSPQDPFFFFHHSQMDRIWSLWQGLDQSIRTREVSSTLTIKNLPPSANGTLDTVVPMGFLADDMTIRDLSSTIDGPFCYVYA